MTTERIPMARPTIDDSDVAAVTDSVRSGVLSRGPRLAEFEDSFADYLGVAHAAGVSSGTAALMVALNAVGVRAGDEVITVSLSFVATANAIVGIGAKPVFVDVRASDLNMDPERIDEAVTDRTRAIVVVHLFGRMADMQTIGAIAQKHGVAVIEDACEALGATSSAGTAGSVGDAAAFGFYANKPLTTGEGGMVVSNEAQVIENCRLLRNQGLLEDARGLPAVVGYSFRLSELHAALGTSQLKRLPENLALRCALAKRYRELLAGCGDLEPPPDSDQDDRHSWFTYPVRLSARLAAERDAIRNELEATGIATRDYFAPIHLMPYYRELPSSDSSALAVTEHEARRLVALPLYPGMRDEHVEAVVHDLRRVVDGRG